jgi:O-antigen ligase
LTVYASATGFVLWGRTETAELVASGGRAIAGGSDAVRIITQTAPLALAVLLGGTAYLLFGRISLGRVVTLLIPAFLITILSFSRNTLLALAGTVVFAVLVALANGLLVRLVLRLAMVPLLVAITVLAVLSVGGALGARDWIETQATGYSNRVFAGLDQANERDDTSANYRDEETQYINRAAADHPLFGGGFGTHYKPPMGKRGTFTAFEGTMYSHNAYNWLYLKVGIAGLAVFVALIMACILPALSRRKNSELLSTAASALAGLAIAIFVTPMPIEQSGSALLAVVMGICIAAPLLTAPSGHRRLGHSKVARRPSQGTHVVSATMI